MVNPSKAPVADLRPNHERVLRLLATSAAQSRTGIAAALGLPKATVTGLVSELIRRGLVVEHDTERGTDPRHDLAPSTTGAGRPAKVITLAGRAPAAGVIVWSAGLLRAAVGTLGGTILAEHTSEAEPGTGGGSFVPSSMDVLAKISAAGGYRLADLAVVVLGVPAPYQRGVGVPVRRSADGREVEHGLASWLRTDPRTELASRTGTAAIVENDANLGALGEFTFGAGRGRDSLIYLKLGQYSVGAGLIIGGRLHRGASGFAGELAHIQIRDDGALCACGGRGCLIQETSALVGAAQPLYEERLTFGHILTLAAGGDPGMRRILGDLGRMIGRPLADMCTMLNPDAIIVDGTAGPAGESIVGGIKEAVARYAAPAVDVIAGELGAQADILGGIALARQELPA